MLDANQLAPLEISHGLLYHLVVEEAEARLEELDDLLLDLALVRLLRPNVLSIILRRILVLGMLLIVLQLNVCFS